MKKSRYLAMALMTVFFLAISLTWMLDTGVASAATTPSFEKTKIELVGEGTTYQMVIKDKIDKSTYSWSSSDTSIAKVNKNGLVTAVSKGTAKITCKVTYPSGKTTKTKTLTCSVTVTIPATSIKINNAKLQNGAHVLTVGDSFDFNCELKPSKTSDKAFWTIAGGDSSVLRMDDAAAGKVTALKAGKAILMVTAAKSATKAEADKSLIRDFIIVEVVEAKVEEPPKPTLEVKGVRVENSNRLIVEFDNPVAANTVVTSSGDLLSNIEITIGKDSKKGLADDPGKLKGSLSSDGKQLTITTEKALNGPYVISFNNQIQSVAGAVLTETFRKFTYTDNIPPSILNTTVDDTGLVVTIRFTEPMNFAGMNISEVGVISTMGEGANSSTLSILKNHMNYIASEDKTSLTIDLSNIAYADRNKTFKVVITGITDMAGNPPSRMYLEAYVRTDTSPKPQARVRNVVRSGYNTITATFSRAIDPLTPGFIQIDGGASIQGKVDSRDNTKVNYTISDADAAFTGVRKVTIGFWNSYNVDPNDLTASKTYDFTVYFIEDKTAPLLVAYEFDPDSNLLTLKYNEEVSITSVNGTLPSIYTSASEDIRPVNISYTELPHSEGKTVIKLRVTNINMSGTYSITIPSGFVSDSFRNYSVSRTISITNVNTSTSGSELPAPYYVAQNTDDQNNITIKFRHKLDTASAQNIVNYSISGVNITSAVLTENTVDGSTVVLTMAPDSVPYNLNYKLTISGVKGYNDSYSAISYYETTIALRENTRPAYKPDPVFDKTTMTAIKINFTETVLGTMTVKVSQIVGSNTIEIPVKSVDVNGSTATINLAIPPSNNSLMYINIVSYDIKDLNGNSLAAMPSTIPLLITYN